MSSFSCQIRVLSLMTLLQSIIASSSHHHSHHHSAFGFHMNRNSHTTSNTVVNHHHYWSVGSSSSSTSTSRTNSVTNIRRWMKEGNDEEDFEFDPLLSPHYYAKGTSSNNNKENSNHNQNDVDDDDDDWSPLKMKSVKDDFKGATQEEYGVEKSIFTRKWSASSVNSVTTDTISTSAAAALDNDDLFDPLLSPHTYSQGTQKGPATAISNNYENNKNNLKQQRIGILLVDHGSRREASNIQLEKLASLYQSRSPSNYVIRAAHMEIVTPSIKDGIKDLIEMDNVDKIVIHPYFLSPGRHVMEDIPQLIDEAIIDLKIGSYNGSKTDSNSSENDSTADAGDNSHVEVLTTSHVGSSMDMMIDMIDAMVGEAIGVVEPPPSTVDGGRHGFVKKDPSSSLGGFFGEVQRMLDEQL